MVGLQAKHPPQHAQAEAAPPAEARYRSLLMTMGQAFCIIEKVATAAGESSDYR